MLNIFRTIKSKLLFSFFIFGLITCAVVLGNIFWFDAKEVRMQTIYDILEEINLNTETAKRLEYVFIHEDVINEKFYETGTCESLKERTKEIKLIETSLKHLKNFYEAKQAGIHQDIDELIGKFGQYEKAFEELVRLTLQRGFKNYGVEGKMREYIHDIENERFNTVRVLTLRRHEKDFIIRKQKEYITKHAQEASTLQTEVANNPKLSQLLVNYQNSFKQLTELEEKIGFTNKEGVKKQLSNYGYEVDKYLNKINIVMHRFGENIKNQNALIQLFTLILTALLIIFVAYYITRILSNPITHLSRSIHQVIQSNFSNEVKFPKIVSQDELGKLSEDLEFMVEKVQDSLYEIQQSSLVVERKHKILMDGVNYGKRIQNAILPDYEIAQYFRKFFILFQPLYDVSGDFYWFTHTENKSYIAVADCTGHGVAGAFMSLIGNNLLNEVVNEKHLEEPAFILETLNTQVRIALRQENQRNEDSLDICLCCVEDIPDKENYKKITFAGASRPLFYSNGWEIHELKGTNRSIGGKERINTITFESTSFELKKGNFLYLTTDGFVNQPDVNSRKYGTPRFMNFLRRISHLPIEEQEQRLKSELIQHLEGTKQRDDITVLALKI